MRSQHRRPIDEVALKSLVGLLDGPNDEFSVFAHYLEIGLEYPQRFLRELRVLTVAS